MNKGALLFYLMIKNHPFQDGHKRLAIATLLNFLTKNDQWLDVKNDQLYDFTKMVAASDARKKDEVMDAINHFIADHLVSFA